MRSKRSSILLFLVAATVAVGPAPALAADLTARAALPKAIEAAKEWQADAVLTNVSSITVNDNGTAKTWFYAFYSPRAKKWLNVTAAGNKIETLEIAKGLTEAVAADFIDSDQAMIEAKIYGVAGESPSMGLTRRGWAVRGGNDPGGVSVWLNAKTGALLSRQVIR